MVRKIDAGNSLGDHVIRKGYGRYVSGHMNRKGRDEKVVLAPFCLST
jgi:hypothetical protein